ncbi:carboxy terminal-processing peptidase [Pseudopedobacter sp.]|uniref:carboxy terminal-processing peptidase n=1 Tax=Pseudopedobacter sp. TaxID=1936787 RepID=UPI0033409B12
MLKKVFSGLLIALAISCTATPRIDKEVAGSNNLKPDPQQGVIAKDISELLTSYTYKKVNLNDSISNLIFDRYIKNLDPNRIYFLDEDIKEFEAFRFQLDNDLKAGDLSAPFYIFNVYQKRYNERQNFSVNYLTKGDFDFSKKDEYVFSREKKAYFKDLKESDAYWTKKVKYDFLNLKLAKKEPTEIKTTLKKRYENLISQANKINGQDVFQLFMTAFTDSVDPHTNYYNPSNAANFNIDMARSLEGIGATLAMENEFVTIKSVVTGGPADKSKQLKIDDKIIGVAQGKDGEFVDVIGWRLDNAIALIRGSKGTIVRLKILSKDQDMSATPKIVSMVREKIILEDQSAKKVIKTEVRGGKTYKYGVIEIPAFYADWKAMQSGDRNYKSTTRDVRIILDSLKKENVDGVIIDLRTNGGGSLLEAIELTGLFIKSGPVVQVRDLRNRVEVNRDEDEGIAWNGPLGVIVDRFSASASEIFAGAIQDYGRGIIIGNTTYGKGTVQSALPMSRINPTLGDKGGQINLTTGKFYRISGSSTQHKGVTPDIEFPTIFPADKYGESSEPSALPWDEIKSSNYAKVEDLSAKIQALKATHDARMKTNKEYQFLLQDIEEFKDMDKEKPLPLNEADLKKQRDEQEAKNLAKENERRVYRGLEPIVKNDSKTKEEDGAKVEAKPKEDKFDFIQSESVKIMTDYILLNKE